MGVAQQGGVLIGVAPAGTSSLVLDGKPVPLAADGRFLIAFDRDAAAEARLTARLAGGRIVERIVGIAPRAWRIERVDVPKRPSVSNEAFERLRAPEIARINAARRVEAASDGWRQRFAWPAKGRISGLFGSQRIYRGGEAGAYHSGVDVAGGAGAPVTAPADGVVVLAAATPFTLEGRLLIIDHGMGLNSAFLHLSSITVKEGDRVKQGQLVGAIGSTGRATGPHLHWAIKWRDARIDPMVLAGAMPGQHLGKVPMAEN
ncbi:M23 family metallopeptidase [Sphingomonas sp. ID1715]|nr:M23 family metallopeptidase [Sphingomonas sp. ID1715]